MSDQIPTLPEVSMGRDQPWLALLVAFIGFWFLFAINAFFVAIFTDMYVGVIAAIASLGQIVVHLGLPITEILEALAARSGIIRKSN